MKTTRSRLALAGAAITLAAGSATGGALIAGGAPAGAAPTHAKAKCAKGKGAKGAKELRKDIRAAIKAAKDGKKEPLTPQALQAVVAPVVKKAVDDGTVKQQFVDKRAARMKAMAAAFGG